MQFFMQLHFVWFMISLHRDRAVTPVAAPDSQEHDIDTQT